MIRIDLMKNLEGAHMPKWDPTLLEEMETTTVELDGETVPVLSHGSPLWHVIRLMGEQTLRALDELGYVRTNGLGQTQGYRIKQLGVTPDGHYAVIHLDVTNLQLYHPTALTRQGKGKPKPYTSLISHHVEEQIRIRISETLDAPVDLFVDNTHWVRYVVDLHSLFRGNFFQEDSLLLEDHIDDRPEPLTLPLGADEFGETHYLDWRRRGRHLMLTGVTGFGKTTLMDTMIMHLVRHTPSDILNFVFMDPQRVNFKPYQMLTDYHFADREGPLGVLWAPEDVVAGMVRLNREHKRRFNLLAETPWASIEEYNQHVPEEECLPYVAVFMDELTLMRELVESELGKQAWATFEQHLKSVIVGGRKVGLRVVLCTQYIKGTVLSPEIVAQTGLQIAFFNSPHGSKNALGDTSAATLDKEGRFILDGLPTSTGRGRKVLQGFYVDRETVLDLLGTGYQRQTFPVDGMVLEILNYALQQLEGTLPRTTLNEVFGHLMSRRQINHLLEALERAGLANPVNTTQVPRQPRTLVVQSIDEAVEILQYYPEIAFHEEEGRLIFGPEKEGRGG
jgi:DNA segregation ATPase FtsK/SpoIIIE-like protein